MAAITIRNLDDALKGELRKRAAAHDRSMEEEARVILRLALRPPVAAVRPGVASEIRELVAEYGGGDLVLPEDAPFVPPDLE